MQVVSIAQCHSFVDIFPTIFLIPSNLKIKGRIKGWSGQMYTGTTLQCLDDLCYEENLNPQIK